MRYTPSIVKGRFVRYFRGCEICLYCSVWNDIKDSESKNAHIFLYMGKQTIFLREPGCKAWIWLLCWFTSEVLWPSVWFLVNRLTVISIEVCRCFAFDPVLILYKFLVINHVKHTTMSNKSTAPGQYKIRGSYFSALMDY